MLDICRSFFAYIDSNKIRYCHWKSNSHLEEALDGKTDLDILIHHEDEEKFKSVVAKFAFVKLLSPSSKRFQDIEDYLGFDHQSGRLIHLHVHFRLILGQRFIKNHHLPIEDIIFYNLIKINNIFIPCPEVELILLFIRAHMKLGIVSFLRQISNDVLGNFTTPFPEEIEKELYALISVSDPQKITDILEEFNLNLSNEVVVAFISGFRQKRLKCYDFMKTKWHIQSSLSKFRRQKNISIYLKYIYLSVRSFPGLNRFLRPQKKTLTGHGKIISLVGADGAGKTTLIRDTEKWLSWKLSVSLFYHGIHKTVLNKLIFYLITGFRKLRLAFIASLVEYWFMLSLAKKRYSISLLSRKETKDGKIVLTDRFPLKVFRDMPQPMDGPRLHKCSNKLEQFFSKKESSYYDGIEYPDIVFVLQVSIDELRKRKSNLSLKDHVVKAEAVNAIKGDAQTILINANRSYQDVQLEIKRKIWECLQSD